MAKKNENPDLVTMFTPRGVLKWPKLTEADHGTEKYPSKHEKGEFKTKIVFDRSNRGVAEFLDKIDALLERAKELAEIEFDKLPVKSRKALEAKQGGIMADLPYSTVYDEETEEDTGSVEMAFKKIAGGTIKKGPKAGQEWFGRVDLFDAKGKPLPRDVVKGGKVVKKGIEIWSGSTAIINADFQPYFVEGTGKYGIQRKINAAQIIELVAAGGTRSASSYGFGEEEGFDADDVATDAGDDDTDDEIVDEGSEDDSDANF